MQVGLNLQPFESLFLEFSISSQEEIFEKESFLEFKTSPSQFKTIYCSYSYSVVEGSVSFQPSIYKYTPAF